MNSHRIALAGGLGNQLFQIAAGIYITNQKEIELDSSFFNPRLNRKGEPEILDLIFDNIYLELSKPKRSRISRKLANIVLGHPTKEKNLIRFLNYKTSKKLLEYLESNINGSLTQIITEGYKSKKSENEKYDKAFCQFLQIGYFQSAGYVTPVRQMLLDFEIKNFDPKLWLSLNKINKEKNLIIHIRRGDYLQEPKFGLVGENYYKRAIELQLNRFEYEAILIFSDDLVEAKKIIGTNYPIQTFYVDDTNLSSGAILKLMSLGYGYIIANSSFSWWSAMLSKRGFDRVIAPIPWFKKVSYSHDILPDNWRKIPW